MKPVKHAFVTVVLPFDAVDGRIARIERCLDVRLGYPVRPAPRARLDRTGILHFAGIHVVPPSSDQFAAHLLIEATSDGTRDDGLAALVDALEPDLVRVLRRAGVGFRGAMIDFLRRHSAPIAPRFRWGNLLGLPFTGTPGMRRGRIVREQALAGHVRELLHDRPPGEPAYRRLEAVRDALWAEGTWKWAFEAEPAEILEGSPVTGIVPWVRSYFGDSVPDAPFDPRSAALTLVRLAAMAFVCLVWPFAFAALLLWAGLYWLTAFAASVLLMMAVGTVLRVVFLLAVRHVETVNEPDDVEPLVAHVAANMVHESRAGVQNLFYAVSPLRHGRLSRLALHLGFVGVEAGTYFARPGFLGSNSIIHFARWLAIPGTDQLVFLSNFDGSWQGYVGDFVMNTAGAKGVTGIWSNCKGFPRTLLLTDDGASDRDRLVRWARRQQSPVHFWYSGYPDITTDRVRTNAAIRQGLALAATAEDAQDWLACFGSAPPAATELDFHEIPAIAFGGMPRLKECAMVAVSLGTDPARAREFLRTLELQVGYGEQPTRGDATVVALSARGLVRLGLPLDARETFPVAFQMGMDAPERAHPNGDVGDDADGQAPGRWHWGAGAQAADVVVLLYGDSETDIARRRDALHADAKRLRHAIAKDLPLERLPMTGPMPNAFGFADGISQPLIRGTRRASHDRDDVLAAGEFVLGYPDQLDRCAPSPTVAAGLDPDHRLQQARRDPGRQRPRFASPPVDSQRDLGRNGTYLVVRQLEQHADRFGAWLDTQSGPLAGPGVPLDPADRRDWLAAKTVGRWPNGTSLADHPHRPGSRRSAAGLLDLDNDFRYRDHDSRGTKCPLGAHARRANPRDGVSPGTPELHATVQTHRMLRVGRPYRIDAKADGDDDGDREEGILFMCVVADIERQFEFVQQRWVLNRGFAGLEDEPDVLLGRGPGRRFSIPLENGTCTVAGMPDFVTLRGGGYFFVPSRAAFSVLAREPDASPPPKPVDAKVDAQTQNG